MSQTDPKVADQPGVMRTTGWGDYALLDSGHGRKLERYGPYSVVRPEPQCMWVPQLDEAVWASAEAATARPKQARATGRTGRGVGA